MLGIERSLSETGGCLGHETAAFGLQGAAPEEQLVGLEILRASSGVAPVRLALHGTAQSRGNGARDLVLHREDVGHLAIVSLRPELVAVGGIGELHGDPKSGPRPADRPFQHRGHVELLADGAQVQIPNAKRDAPRHAQAFDLRGAFRISL